MRWLSSPLRRETLCQMAQCPFMLLSVLYLRHEAALLLLVDEDESQLWLGCNILMAPQIFEWHVIGVNDQGQPQNYCSLRLDGSSHTGPHFPPSQSVPHSQCLQKPAAAWITTCQDAACLSASLSAHSNTQPHKHRCTCKHKHTLSMCLIEWPDKKTWHYLLGVSVYLCVHIHTHAFLLVCESVCMRVHIVCAVKMLMSYLSWWPFLLCWCLVFFYKYRADILGCVITVPQQHAASLLVFWQWPSPSPLSSVCVLVCAKLFCCPVCTAES